MNDAPFVVSVSHVRVQLPPGCVQPVLEMRVGPDAVFLTKAGQGDVTNTASWPDFAPTVEYAPAPPFSLGSVFLDVALWSKRAGSGRQHGHAAVSFLELIGTGQSKEVELDSGAIVAMDVAVSLAPRARVVLSSLALDGVDGSVMCGAVEVAWGGPDWVRGTKDEPKFKAQAASQFADGCAWEGQAIVLEPIVSRMDLMASGLDIVLKRKRRLGGKVVAAGFLPWAAVYADDGIARLRTGTSRQQRGPFRVVLEAGGEVYGTLTGVMAMDRLPSVYSTSLGAEAPPACTAPGFVPEASVPLLDLGAPSAPAAVVTPREPPPSFESLGYGGPPSGPPPPPASGSGPPPPPASGSYTPSAPPDIAPAFPPVSAARAPASVLAPVFVPAVAAPATAAAAPANPVMTLMSDMFANAVGERESGEYRAALDSFGTLVEMGGADESVPGAFVLDCLVGRGQTYLAMGSYSLAVSDADRVLEEAAEHADALALRGAAREKQGRSEDAMMDYVAALSVDEHNTAALIGMERVSSGATPAAPARVQRPQPVGAAAAAGGGGGGGGPAAALPPFWEERKMDDGRVYWWDHANDKKQWRLPPEYEARATEPLPPFWEEAVDARGRVFYMNHKDQTTTWVRPRA